MGSTATTPRPRPASAGLHVRDTVLLALAWIAAITAASFTVFHRLASPRTT